MTVHRAIFGIHLPDELHQRTREVADDLLTRHRRILATVDETTSALTAQLTAGGAADNDRAFGKRSPQPLRHIIGRTCI